MHQSQSSVGYGMAYPDIPPLSLPPCDNQIESQVVSRPLAARHELETTPGDDRDHSQGSGFAGLLQDIPMAFPNEL